jgi:GT2 family glycosyltransferase/glycosyltransferase involved in cell wall biosynthesis
MATIARPLSERAGASPSAPIDVVVPVYNAPQDVARCVDSVLAHTSNYRLVLIDDASPDTAITAYFADLARRSLPQVTLLRNAVNLGFTGSANRGFAFSRADVVLLNSDTVVTEGWLEAIARCAQSDPSIGTITPFSNNAEICSYPRFCADNRWPEGLDPEPTRAAIARAAVPTYPDLPTGVGFCMFVRRALIDAIGAFDPAFGRGYGEENDFCLRAARAGWRNVLCDDAFVLHLGGRSFAGEKARLGARNMPLVLERHPQYLDLVRSYIAADPLRPIREAALTSARAHDAARPGVLHLLHGGGGTERHARSLIASLTDECRHYVAIATGDRWRIEDHDAGEARVFDLAREPGESWAAFVGAIAATFRIDLVHVHHLSKSREGVLEAFRSLDLRYGVTVHDLWLACPTVTLSGPDGRFCGGVTDVEACARCLAAQPAFDGVDIAAWRREHAKFVAGARFVIAPSRWAADMLARYFARHDIDVIPHAALDVAATNDAESAREPVDSKPPMAIVLPPDDILSIAVVGAIGPDKGARRVERLAALARERGERLRFVVIGYLDVQHEPWQSADAVLTVHGRYDPRDLPALLAHYRVALVAYPSAGPESFSFTLSEVWAAGRPAIVPPIGALAERVAESGAGWVWTEDEWKDEARMLDRIVDVVSRSDEIGAASRSARRFAQPTLASMAARTFACYSKALESSLPIRAQPLANARVRDALGYTRWAPPAPKQDDAPPVSTGVAADPIAAQTHAGIGAAIARVALRWRHTSIGRALYRVAPAPLVDALKERLR